MRGNHYSRPTFRIPFFSAPLAGHHKPEHSTWVETDPQVCSRMLNALQLLARSVSFSLLQAAWVTLRKEICIAKELAEKPDSHTLQLSAPPPPEITILAEK